MTQLKSLVGADVFAGLGGMSLGAARAGIKVRAAVAHAELQALRDHLHLLAQLSIPEHQHPDSLVVSGASLADCFIHLPDTADRIVAAMTA